MMACRHQVTFYVIDAHEGPECLLLPGLVWRRHRKGSGVADAVHAGWLFWCVAVHWARVPREN